MTIQKKSLINSLNTTKKALAASTPVAGSATSGTVKPGKQVYGTAKHGRPTMGMASPKFAKYGKPTL